MDLKIVLSHLLWNRCPQNLCRCLYRFDSLGVTTYKRHRFSTYTQGLKELSQWLCENSCTDVCMEYNGKYWIPVFNILEISCSITLAHPKYVKVIRGKRRIKKMRNGLPIYSNMILSPEALCRRLRFGSFVT